MSQLKKIFLSSLGRKYLMALSGLGLVGFVITHLLGNLALLDATGSAFNQYAHKLESFGALLWAAEVGLLGIFVLHIVTAITLKKGHFDARPTPYARWNSKGSPSKANFSSRSMILTGSILLIFLVLHIIQFKFGPGIQLGYVDLRSGHPVRDLYRLVFETFQNPFWVGVYCTVMVLLGFHLRHGFWSAFQSLGLAYPRYSKSIERLGLLIALLLTFGFLCLPLILFGRSLK